MNIQELRTLVHHLKTTLPRFDYIISNPPYQMSDGGGMGSSAVPIYNLFTQQAFLMKPQGVSFIIPARWFTGGKGLDNFRMAMLTDTSLSSIVDIPNAKECFPTADIKGGVCLFHWVLDKDSQECLVSSVRNGKTTVPVSRPLGKYDVLIRENEAVSILEKVLSISDSFVSSSVSSRKPFGIKADFSDFAENQTENKNIKLYARGRTGWIEKDQIGQNISWVSRWKVLVPKASSGDGKIPNQVTTTPVVAAPPSCCTETYLVLGLFTNKLEAERFAEYTKTRFFRFLVSLRKTTQNATKDSFAFVPTLPLNQDWTDELLYQKYGLSEDEIAFIISRVREMI